MLTLSFFFFFFFQAEDGIRDLIVTGVQTCALPISGAGHEADHPGDQERLPAEHVAELPGHRDDNGRRDQVAGRHPRVDAEAVEVSDDAGHGGPDDGLVERHQEQRQHHAQRCDRLLARRELSHSVLLLLWAAMAVSSSSSWCSILWI